MFSSKILAKDFGIFESGIALSLSKIAIVLEIWGVIYTILLQIAGIVLSISWGDITHHTGYLFLGMLLTAVVVLSSILFFSLLSNLLSGFIILVESSYRSNHAKADK